MAKSKRVDRDKMKVVTLNKLWFRWTVTWALMPASF